MNNEVNLWEVIVTKFDKLDEKLESLDKHKEETNKILAKQEVTLDIHVKRCDLLEAKMVPIEKHISLFNAGLKIVGGTTVLITLISGLLKILQYIQG